MKESLGGKVESCLPGSLESPGRCLALGPQKVFRVLDVASKNELFFFVFPFPGTWEFWPLSALKVGRFGGISFQKDEEKRECFRALEDPSIRRLWSESGHSGGVPVLQWGVTLILWGSLLLVFRWRRLAKSAASRAEILPEASGRSGEVADEKPRSL